MAFLVLPLPSLPFSLSPWKTLGHKSATSTNGIFLTTASPPLQARSPLGRYEKKKSQGSKTKNDLTLEIVPNLTGPDGACRRNKKAASGRDTSPFLLLSFYCRYFPLPLSLFTLVHSFILIRCLSLPLIAKHLFVVHWSHPPPRSHPKYTQYEIQPVTIPVSVDLPVLIGPSFSTIGYRRHRSCYAADT